jgi:hypothetical protein
MTDPEIEAMAKCHEQLNPLDAGTKIRVIQWLISKYELNSQTSVSNGAPKSISQNKNEMRVVDQETSVSENEETLVAVPQPKQNNEIENFETVGDLFAATSPTSDWEKALVVATYLQLKDGFSDFTGFDVNKELKHLGHGVQNITRPIQVCIDKKPQLIIQLRKEGKTRQAKKKFKVSAEGLKIVKGMINS